ncbi:MAG: hypothetical protein HY682_11835 [Chloroflexi bacterium]|nr:hypothetical protein [Chloroflexota bacterium]
METVQLARDAAIIAFAVVAMITTAVFGLMAWRLYRRISGALESARAITSNMASMSGILTDGRLRPLVFILGSLGSAFAGYFAARKRREREKVG